MFFKTFLRFWWVVSLGAALGVAIALLTFHQGTPVYSSTAKLFVQGGSDAGSLSASELDESRRVSQLYGDLATTRPILEAISADLDVPYTADELRGKIAVRESRSFIELTVTDRDPDLASTVANVSAATLINELTERQFAQISQFQDSLAQLGVEQGPAIVAAQAANLPLLSVAEEAIASSSPSNKGSSRTTRAVVGGILGLLAGSLLVVARNALDDTIKTEDELAQGSGLRILGTVPRYRLEGRKPLLSNGTGRHHPAAESYYMVRANLDYVLARGSTLRTILVTGPGPEEGKSTMAANLAVAFANEGRSVVLVDADLRRPVQHIAFGIDPTDGQGVTDVLRGTANIDEVLVSTGVPGLRLMPAGDPPTDPSLLLRGEGLGRLKRELFEYAEIVVYDSPPVLVVPDPLLIAEGLGVTVLVTESGSTRRRAIRRSVEALSRTGTGPITAVLTKQRMGITGYDPYGYGYSSYYGARENGAGEAGARAQAVATARRVARRTVFWRNGRH